MLSIYFACPHLNWGSIYHAGCALPRVASVKHTWHRIAQYLGRVYEPGAVAPLTSYLVRGLDDAVSDASVERSWASMANHSEMPNAICVHINVPASFQDDG